MLTDVQANVARQLLLHDVTASVEHDFELFSRTAAQAPDWHDKGNPIFEPAWNTLTPDNSFWLCFRDAKGEAVFISANRIHRDARFVDLVRSNRLIYDGTKEVGRNFFELSYEAEFAHIRGTLCYMGAAWVHPRLRGNALPTLALALTQAKALQDYECDYTLAPIRPAMMTKGVAINTYRFSHFHFGMIYNRSETNERFDAWLMYQNRQDMERELALWVTPAPVAAPVRRIA